MQKLMTKNNRKTNAKRATRDVIDTVRLPEYTEIQRAEAMYLHSFVDPHCAARGPAVDECPTALVTLHTTSLVSVDVPTAGATVPNGTNPTAINMNSSGAIMFLCGFNAFAPAAAAAGTAVNLRSTYAIDPDLPWNNAMHHDNPTPAGETVGALFGEWDIAYPGGTSITYTDPQQGYNLELPHRVVGLKAEIESTTSVLDNQGYIYAGDFSHVFSIVHSDVLIAHGATSTYTQESRQTLEMQSNMAANRGEVAMNNRLCTAGPIMLGKTYEATFLPQNDAVTEFRSQHFESECQYTGSPMYNACLNEPQVCFVLRGLDTTKVYSFRLAVTLALEVPVTKAGPIGILYSEARHSNRYLVNWIVMTQFRPGGVRGITHQQWLGHDLAVLSHAIHAGVARKPQLLPPHQMGVSTHPITRSVVNAVKQGAAALGNHAISAIKPHAEKAAKSFLQSLLTKGGHWLERSAARAVGAIGRNAVPMIEGIGTEAAETGLLAIL